MGIVWTFTTRGEDGGTWCCAAYPLGATRYYRTEDARSSAVDAYADAIRATGGRVRIADVGERRPFESDPAEAIYEVRD